MKQSLEKQILSRIRGKGRDWAFSPKDFTSLGKRTSIDVAVHRLAAKGTIRRVTRGIYDYPRYSEMLGRVLSPDLHQVAGAIARKFGWRIQPIGAAALNLLGLSTQVVARIAYLSDGPSRTYDIDGRELVFKHAMLKESGFRYRESSLIVQALKSLGRERVSADAIEKLRGYLGEELRPKVLKDTATATGWIRDTILEICTEKT